MFQIITDIAEAEKTIVFLNKQILEKEAPLKKVQTRLHLRNERPNVELCDDKAHAGYVQYIFNMLILTS